MKYYNSYKDFLNEKVDNSINEASDEQEALKNFKGSDKPRIHIFQDKDIKSDIDVYKPLDSDDIDNIDKYIVFNPETKHFVTIKAFNDYFKKVEAGEITEAVAKGKVVKPTKELKKVKASIDSIKSTVKKPIELKSTAKIKDDVNDEVGENKNPKKSINTKGVKESNKLTDTEFNANVKSGKNKILKFKDGPVKLSSFKLKTGKSVSSLLESKMPKASIETIERLLNMSADGKPKITNVTSGAGAGQIQSQLGELLTTAGICMNNDEFKSFHEKLAEKFKDINNGVYSAEWMESAAAQRNAAMIQLNNKFGKGKWSVEIATWDVVKDVEDSMFDKYEQKEGSTDYFVRVKTSKGSWVMENSLKKDSVTFAYNGSAGDLKHQMMLVHPDKKIKSEYLKLDKELNLLRKQYGNISDMKQPYKKQASEMDKKMQQLQEKNSGLNPKIDQSEFLKRQKNDWAKYGNSLNKYVKDILAINITKVPVSPKGIGEAYDVFKKAKTYLQSKKKFPDTTSPEFNEVLKTILGSDKTGPKYMSKLMVSIATVIKNEGKSKELLKLSNNVIDSRQKDYSDFTSTIATEFEKNKHFKDALNAKFVEVIPVVGMLKGTEQLQLGGVPIYDDVLKDAFGINSADEFKQNMTLKRTPDGNVEVILKGKGKGKDISIAKLGIRQKGLMYDSAMGMELAFHDEFFCVTLNSAYKISKAKDPKFQFSELYDNLPSKDKNKANKCTILQSNNLVKGKESKSKKVNASKFNNYSSFLNEQKNNNI